MKIAIIGSGIVGTATGRGLLSMGHEVVFFDINPLVLENLERQGLDTCGERQCLREQEIFMVSVSTPTVDQRIQLNFMKSAMANLGKVLKTKNNYSVVVVRSTVPPGTTQDLLIPILEQYSEKKAYRDFGVCVNPEFLREASSEEDFENPRVIVVGASDGRSIEKLDVVYSSVDALKYRVGLMEAEFLKYTHNLMNAAKISFFNEMRQIASAIEIDADKIFAIVAKSAEASWNEKYGIRNFGPFGGSCLPKDTQAFLSWAKESLSMEMALLEAVIRVNEELKMK